MSRTTKKTKGRRRRATSSARLAEMIVDDLFSNACGEKAERLVLELRGGKDGGGWCRSAARGRIEDILKAVDGKYKLPEMI